MNTGNVQVNTFFMLCLCTVLNSNFEAKAIFSPASTQNSASLHQNNICCNHPLPSKHTASPQCTRTHSFSGTCQGGCSEHPGELTSVLLWIQAVWVSSVSSCISTLTPWSWDQSSVGGQTICCTTLLFFLSLSCCRVTQMAPLRDGEGSKHHKFL